MCGIFGVLNLDGRPSAKGTLQAMARSSIHSGPDDEGFHLDGACGIGMRRLAIIDLAGGHQPLADAEGGL
jgi:asparagine synthase (glutamine-hydrolysing)